MAKTSMLEREKKRRQLALKYKGKREALKAKVRDPRSTPQERFEAQLALQAIPRNASPVRQRNRCALTGRSRGYYRRFGLGRNKLRELALRGEVPGVIKASW